jgi:molybdopterin-binding protein
MKLSARNIIKGKVVEVKKGAVAASVKVDIGGGSFGASAMLTPPTRSMICVLIEPRRSVSSPPVASSWIAS